MNIISKTGTFWDKVKINLFHSIPSYFRSVNFNIFFYDDTIHALNNPFYGYLRGRFSSMKLVYFSFNLSKFTRTQLYRKTHKNGLKSINWKTHKIRVIETLFGKSIVSFDLQVYRFLHRHLWWEPIVSAIVIKFTVEQN